ncbi:unnamed protein product [Prorocentrum cordatum]|uniref:Uncharacterized protein n=1 Tax=Prorocentrum cordatum TaxID=2364126 RepID=A0ABN9UHD0_9DINO|nr:unnamed protein product [Polarella glacialis]
MEAEKLPRLLGAPARRAKRAFAPPRAGPVPDLPSAPGCFPAAGHAASNAEVPPEKWAMTVGQWNEFVQFCRSTDRWRVLDRRSGYVSAHDACDHFVKPWTRGTGCGVALNMNAAAPKEAQLMLSHTWAEDLTECAEALNAHCRRNDLSTSTCVWFCLFSNYQAGDDEGDVGPTVAEQLAMDPFGHVIRSARKHHGMLVIHTSQAEVYERLWCVYEIATALREDCTTRSACSQRYADTGRRRLQSVLDVNTTKAKCSSTNDEAFICDRVSKSGGFERLDREIFQFRVSMLLEQAEEAGHNRLESLTKAITKVEKRLELESSSSSSIGSWVAKLGVYRVLCLLLAFLALGGVLAAFAAYQSSQGILSDVVVTPEPAAVPTPHPTFSPTAAPSTSTSTPPVVIPTAPPIPPVVTTTPNAIPPVVTTTALPVPPIVTTTPNATPPVVTTTTPPAIPTSPVTPNGETTAATSTSPAATITSPTPPAATSTSPHSTTSAGGQTTTERLEEDQTPPRGGSTFVRLVLLIGGAVAALVLLVLLVPLLGRLGCCSGQAGDVERGTAVGQPSRRVQLERLELMRQMMSEVRAREADHQAGVEAV